MVSFQLILDIEKYRLNDRNTKCNTKVLKRISNQAHRVKVMLGPKEFNNSDPITLLSFLSDLPEAFNIAAVHEGAAEWIILH